MKLLDIIKQHTEYKQFVPTNKDLKSDELNKLSNRLKASSQDKTFINILEWQDRNIKYWEERASTSLILTLLIIFSLTMIISFFGKTDPTMYWLFLLFPFLILGGATLNIIIYLITLLFSVLFIPVSLALITPSITLNSKMLLLFIGSSFVLGAFISLILNLILKYSAIKRFTPEFKLGDTFKLSLSIQRIINYRLSICRDYAKLTSALLLKLYPKEEIYFVLIQGHVAVVVKLKDKLYVIDQKLPILTLENWVEKWRRRHHKKKLDLKLVRLYLEDNNVRIQHIKQKNFPYYLQSSNLNELNIKVKKLFKLNNTNIKQKDAPLLEIPLKNLISYFSNDDLFNLSLIELIKNKIEDELVGNIDKLNNLEIVQKDNNLVLRIWLK